MSYCIYIGKNHSADGHAWLAGYGDEPSSHWIEIVSSQKHPANAQLEVGVTPMADLPGVRSRIPQAEQTLRNVRVNYSYYKGLPAPLTNGGLNERGVAVRSVWSPSRKELVDLTPETQKGPNYSDFAAMLLERATTAREGVNLVADIIRKFGESSYGGNAHIIADASEAWIMIQPAGGIGLWAAERLGDDSIRAFRPGYIGTIPIAENSHPDFLYSENLVSFARKKGWYETGPFDFNKVFGDGLGPWAGALWIEAEVRSRASRTAKLSFHDVVWALRTERLTGDSAGYGQIVPLTDVQFNELRMLWHAPCGAVSAPFAPLFLGQQSIPPEFGKHRYLMSGESSRFLDESKPIYGEADGLSNVPQNTEAFPSAFAECKRLLYLTIQGRFDFLPRATEALKFREQDLARQTRKIVASARALMEIGHHENSTHLLTYFSTNELLNGLELVKALNKISELQIRSGDCLERFTKPLSFDQIW